MKIINVKCTFIIPVEIPDNKNYDKFFDIEENHCPGTGLVGIAFDKHYKKHDTGNKKGFCWACALKGRNEII